MWRASEKEIIVFKLGKNTRGHNCVTVRYWRVVVMILKSRYASSSFVVVVVVFLVFCCCCFCMCVCVCVFVFVLCLFYTIE